MTLHDSSAAFQAYLEGLRRDPDNEQLTEDLAKARIELEVEWLESCATRPIDGHPS